MTAWADMTASDKTDAVIAGIFADKTYSQMADMFGTSRSAVAGVANRIRKKFPSLLPEQRPGVARRQGSTRTIARAVKTKVVMTGPRGQRHAVAVPPPTAPSAPVAPIEPQRIIDLNDLQCRFPVAGPSLDGHWFCAAPCERSDPYCEAHSKIARSKYQPPIIKQNMRRKAQSHG